MAHAAAPGGTVPGLKKTKSMYVMRELVSTEETYVRSLRRAVEAFQRPMAAARVATATELKQLFGGMEHLLPLNEALLADLQRAEADPAVSIGSVFLRFAGFLKLYLEYIGNNGRATELLAALLKRKKVAKFVAKVEKATMDTLAS